MESGETIGTVNYTVGILAFYGTLDKWNPFFLSKFNKKIVDVVLLVRGP